MTATAPVTPGQRHTQDNPCPICGGGRDDPSGHGIRCWGFTSGDRLYAHCTREDYAGNLQPNSKDNTFAHRLVGSCACGEAHGEAHGTASERPSEKETPHHACRYPDLPQALKGGYTLTAIYPYHQVAGQPHTHEVRRFDLPDGSDKTYRPYSQRPDGLWVEKRLGDWPLYCSPELAAAPPDAPVVVCEGEKCADAARAALRAAGMNWPVTTTQGGAKSSHRTPLDALKGRCVVILPDHDADGAIYAQKVADAAHKAGATLVTTLPLEGLKEKGDVANWLALPGHDGAALAQLITKALADERAKIEAAQPHPLLVTLADVTPERPKPLWPGYLWLGKIAVLDGDPGLSKSTITLDLAARVSRGRTMPDGSAGIPPAHVILLSAEDGAADTIRPRLDAADGDPRRVHLLDGWQTRDEKGDIIEHGMTLPGDLDVLEAAIRQVGTQLVVIDPLMAFLAGDVNSYRDQDVRGALRPLAAIAERTGACVIIVRHLNKATGGNALYRGGGSIGISGAARSVLLVTPDPEDPEADKPGGKRVLSHIKSNLGPLMPSWSYRPVDADGAPRIEWLGVKKLTPAQLLSQPQSEEEQSERADAVDFLEKALAAGKRPSLEVQKEADTLGISKRTLARARKKLSVDVTHEGGLGANGYWVLALPPKDATPPTKGATPEDGGTLSKNAGSNAAPDADSAYECQPTDNGILSSDSGTLSAAPPSFCQRPRDCARRMLTSGRMSCGLCDMRPAPAASAARSGVSSAGKDSAHHDR